MFPTLPERSEVNSYRQTFGMLALILGVALPPLIYSTLGWDKMGLIFGSIITAVVLITLLGSREKKEFSMDKPLGIKDAISKTFTSRSFLAFVISNLFIQYTFTIILAAIPFFAKYVLNVGPKETSLMLLTTFLTAIAMMYFWRIFAVRFGPKNTYMAAISFLAFSLLPFFVVKNYMACIISTSLVGIGLAGIILISDILISDVIDEDELRSGVRREGMFFGFNAFICRFAIALEAASLGIVFTLTGYNPNILGQSSSYILGLRLLIAGLPILSLIIAAVVMIFYPLSGKRLIEIRKELELLHDLKAKQYF
jgi:GPH family glycoside/pentoside/hexuronide:cation symporter